MECDVFVYIDVIHLKNTQQRRVETLSEDL